MRAEGFTEKEQELTHSIIGASLEIHRALGPGLLESAYEECLSYELAERGLSVERQPGRPIVYKAVKLALAYRPDLVVERTVVVELKTVERLMSVHTAQLLTYLKLEGLRVGLLLNFNSAPLMNGIKRVVL
jgi:GxxExxY protein